MSYLTFENIYFWSNLGLIPFWLMLIIIPNSNFTQFFVNSIVLPLLLSTAYIYVIKQSVLLDISFLEIFTLYFTPSLDTHDPKKIFKAKKCNQKKSKKLSVANIIYKLSKLKYNLKTSNIGSSNKTAW